jgi:hypothetical protein
VTNGSTRDYRVGRKNNWRRWGWNRLLERTGGAELQDPILYLAGPQDLDRAVAVAKGVPPENLIAIDRCRRNVNGVRRAGGVAICADAILTLGAWPKDRPVAAIVLDFCCGLEPVIVRGLIDVMRRRPFRNAVVWLNFQRGRDFKSNAMRAGLADLVQYYGPLTLDRARQFFLLLVVARVREAGQDGHLNPMTPLSRCVAVWTSFHRPIFRSYESHGERGSALVFDSVVMHAQPQGVEACEVLEERRVSKPVRRLIGAALAVRTMRTDR